VVASSEALGMGHGGLGDGGVGGWWVLIPPNSPDPHPVRLPSRRDGDTDPAAPGGAEPPGTPPAPGVPHHHLTPRSRPLSGADSGPRHLQEPKKR